MISKPMRFAVLGLLAALLLAGCEEVATVIGPKIETPPATPTPVEVVNVGVFLPLKGESAASGEEMLDGLVVAAELTNAAGGVLGRPVRLVVRDTKSEPDRVAKAVQDLITVDKALCVVGGLTGAGLEANAVAEELQVPLIAPGSTMPGVRSNEPWTIRICYRDFLSGRVMAKFAASLGATRAAVLYDPSSDYAKALALAFGKAFKSKRGHKIVGEPYETGTTDFSRHIEAIKKMNPEVVYLPSDPRQAAAILVQARAAGLEIPFLGTATWDSSEFLREAAEAARNTYLPGRFNPRAETPAAKTFVAAYLAKHKKSPSAMSALGYDALQLFLEAFRTSGGVGGEPLRKALEETINFDGATGEITVDPSVGVSKAVPILRVKDGEFAFVETLAP